MVQQSPVPNKLERPGSSLPYRPQSALNASLNVGLSSTILAALATTYGLFSIAGGDPGLAWLGVLTVWTAYAAAMAVLWFATVSEAP